MPRKPTRVLLAKFFNRLRAGFAEIIARLRAGYAETIAAGRDMDMWW